jgi:hypothetical protein
VVDVQKLKEEHERLILKKTIVEHKRMDGREFKLVRVENAKVVPEKFHVITTYEELSRYTVAFAEGVIPFMLLIGPPGAGKSKQMQYDLAVGTPRQTCTWIDNKATPFGLYCKVYEGHNRPVVLDDVGYFFDNKAAQSLIKSLCQTDKVKRISWESANKDLEKNEIPKQYETTSHVCFIANKWEANNVDMRAVADRALCCAFHPSPATIHERVIQLGFVKDKEVLEFMGENIGRTVEWSMREYHHAEIRKLIDPNWRKVTLDVLGIKH